MNCLRNIPMEDILKHLKTFPVSDQINNNSLTQLFEPWAPIFDNVLLDKHPFYYFKEVWCKVLLVKTILGFLFKIALWKIVEWNENMLSKRMNFNF